MENTGKHHCVTITPRTSEIADRLRARIGGNLPKTVLVDIAFQVMSELTDERLREAVVRELELRAEAKRRNRLEDQARWDKMRARMSRQREAARKLKGLPDKRRAASMPDLEDEDIRDEAVTRAMFHDLAIGVPLGTTPPMDAPLGTHLANERG